MTAVTLHALKRKNVQSIGVSEDRFRLILQRAEEIEATTGTGQEMTRADEQLIEAAQEAGLSRDAVMQALRERFALENVHLQVNSLVFALSTDRHFYPAKITSIEGEVVRVTFLNGGEHTVRRPEVKPFTMLPGQMISVPWPNWGWWNSKIISFDGELMKVRVSDNMGSELTVPISETRLKPDVPPSEVRERWKAWMNYGAIALGSGALGAIIMRIILR